MRLKIVFSLLWLLTLLPINAQETINLRMMWFDDGNESVILQTLIEEFETQNPNIRIELDLLPDNYYSDILLEQLEAGTSPDIARHTRLGEYGSYYLDLRPYLDNPADWDTNFPAPFLEAMRDTPDDRGLHGYPSDITVSAPFINRDLFEQAGVPVPSDIHETTTCPMWTEAAAEVQAVLNDQGLTEIYGLAMDRSGHRFWGMSLGMCATYLDENEAFQVDNPGFRDAAELLQNWHINGITQLDIWGGVGDQYIEPRDTFIAGELAMYYSGNWQIARFNGDIGDTFNWGVVPNPTESCGSSGMVGGGAVTAFNTTAHPEAVGQFMSFLTTPDNMARYYEFNLMLPGYLSLAASGLDYPTNADKLNTFASELATLQEQAFRLQYHPNSGIYHGAIRRGLIEMVIEELTIDETITRIETEIATAEGS